MDRDVLINIVALVSIPAWMCAILVMARRNERHWAWMFLGLIQLPGLAIATAWFFWIRPKKDELSQLRDRYARGEIGEEEYLRAMTRGDRAG